MAKCTIDLKVLPDRRLGKPVYHIVWPGEEHVAETTCACMPQLIRMEQCGAYWIEVWWHKREEHDGGL